MGCATIVDRAWDLECKSVSTIAGGIIGYVSFN